MHGTHHVAHRLTTAGPSSSSSPNGSPPRRVSTSMSGVAPRHRPIHRRRRGAGMARGPPPSTASGGVASRSLVADVDGHGLGLRGGERQRELERRTRLERPGEIRRASRAGRPARTPPPHPPGARRPRPAASSSSRPCRPSCRAVVPAVPVASTTTVSCSSTVAATSAGTETPIELIVDAGSRSSCRRRRRRRLPGSTGPTHPTPRPLSPSTGSVSP